MINIATFPLSISRRIQVLWVLGVCEDLWGSVSCRGLWVLWVLEVYKTVNCRGLWGSVSSMSPQGQWGLWVLGVCEGLWVREVCEDLWVLWGSVSSRCLWGFESFVSSRGLWGSVRICELSRSVSSRGLWGSVSSVRFCESSRPVRFCEFWNSVRFRYCHCDCLLLQGKSCHGARPPLGTGRPWGTQTAGERRISNSYYILYFL